MFLFTPEEKKSAKSDYERASGIQTEEIPEASPELSKFLVACLVIAFVVAIFLGVRVFILAIP